MMPMMPIVPVPDFATAVRRLMKQRLHLAPVLTRRLATMPLQFANPVWVEDGSADMDWHVQRVAVPAPGTQAELEATVARLKRLEGFLTGRS